jgi:hypothetical protein
MVLRLLLKLLWTVLSQPMCDKTLFTISLELAFHIMRRFRLKLLASKLRLRAVYIKSLGHAAEAGRKMTRIWFETYHCVCVPKIASPMMR